MAYFTPIRTSRAGLLDRLAWLRKDIGERYAQYRVYRRTLAELEGLSDRELTDLGLDRSMIQRVAIDAAYGE